MHRRLEANGLLSIIFTFTFGFGFTFVIARPFLLIGAQLDAVFGKLNFLNFVGQKLYQQFISEYNVFDAAIAESRKVSV